MKLGYILCIAGLALILWLGNGVRRIGSVSTGEQIPERNGTALLLVDLQTVFWSQGPYSDLDKEDAEEVILAEVKAAQAKGHPVIALRQEWSEASTKAVARLTMKGQAVEGSDGVELDKAFADLPDHTLVKRVQDAFETGELDRLLDRLEVGKLRIVGLDFNFCIQKTARAARNRGYEVTVIKAGTLSTSDTDKAEKQMSASGVSLF